MIGRPVVDFVAYHPLPLSLCQKYAVHLALQSLQMVCSHREQYCVNDTLKRDKFCISIFAQADYYAAYVL